MANQALMENQEITKTAVINDKNNSGGRTDGAAAPTLGALKETHIKKIIEDHPAVGAILNEYSIGCVTCNVGTCLLKDVVEFHYLPDDKKQEMWTRIEAAVAEGANTDTGAPTKIEPAAAPPEHLAAKEIRYSPPIKKLVDEHLLIKRWLALIPAVIENLDIDSEKDRELILEGVSFIRNYADRYHHAKEEEILFRLFDENLEIFRVMHEDHTNARNHVKGMLEAVAERDEKKLIAHLAGYGELLRGHIQKEDEILYTWIDRRLSDREIGELYMKFAEVDRQFSAADDPGKYERFVERLEMKYVTLKRGS